MAPPVFSPKQEAELDRRFDETNAALAELMKEIRRLKVRIDRLEPCAPPSAPPSAPTPTQSELPPLPAPPAPPATKQTPAYPPAPSVEALEEVEYIQVYKPLRNIRKQPIRQKHRAAKALPKAMRKTCDAEVFGNIIAWPPKFGGTNMRLSRDQHLDAWYTTMLNTHAKAQQI